MQQTFSSVGCDEEADHLVQRCNKSIYKGAWDDVGSKTTTFWLCALMFETAILPLCLFASLHIKVKAAGRKWLRALEAASLTAQKALYIQHIQDSE